jgi:hypothetical protein
VDALQEQEVYVNIYVLYAIILIMKKVHQRRTYHNNGADHPKSEKKNIKKANDLISFFQTNINVY